MKYDVLIGTKFGRLTVVSKSVKRDGWRQWWVCKCDCGNEVILNTTYLRSGHTKSCGCLRRETARQNFIAYNNSEKRKSKIEFFETEKGREVVKIIGKTYGMKNLLMYNNSEKGRADHKRIGAYIGKRYGAKALTEYVRSEKGREACKERGKKCILKLCKPTLSQQILSKALSDDGIDNRMEWWINEYRRLIDIAVPSSKLAIEVDGSSHEGFNSTKEEKQADDKLKDQQLQSLGWKVMRVTNQEVNSTIGIVLERIKNAL